MNNFAHLWGTEKQYKRIEKSNEKKPVILVQRSYIYNKEKPEWSIVEDCWFLGGDWVWTHMRFDTLERKEIVSIKHIQSHKILSKNQKF